MHSVKNYHNTAAPPWNHWVSSVEYYQIATHETLNAAPLPAICSLLESSITCQVATHGSCLVHFLEAVLSFQVVERFNIYHIVALPHTAHPCVCSLQVFEYYEYHIAAHEAPRAAAAQGLPDCNFRCLRLSLCFDSSTFQVMLVDLWSDLLVNFSPGNNNIS